MRAIIILHLRCMEQNNDTYLLTLSIIATVLCPILGVFPLILSICAIEGSKKESNNIEISNKKRSHYKGWIISLLIIEVLLLTIAVIHIWSVIMR